MAKKKEILLGITGSIAAYKACDIITSLKRLDFNVTPVMTEEAKYFITPLTLQTLSGRQVIGDLFAMPETYDVLHTSLADRSDLILVAPATANIIGKLANGIADDILSCSIMASRSPILIAPAMNDKMYTSSGLTANISKLKKAGYKFIGPVRGKLACGYEGMGHIASTETIVSEVRKALK